MRLEEEEETVLQPKLRLGHHAGSLNDLIKARGDKMASLITSKIRNVRSNANSVERPSNDQDSSPINDHFRKPSFGSSE